MKFFRNPNSIILDADNKCIFFFFYQDVYLPIIRREFNSIGNQVVNDLEKFNTVSTNIKVMEISDQSELFVLISQDQFFQCRLYSVKNVKSCFLHIDLFRFLVLLLQ